MSLLFVCCWHEKRQYFQDVVYKIWEDYYDLLTPHGLQYLEQST